MPLRSPTLAFDPTPALAHSRFSAFNDLHGDTGMDHYSNGDSAVKGVRFEEPVPVNPTHGRHSIATSNVPLLPPINSASHLPKQSFRITNPTPGVDITAYFEQCRNVNERLRQAHAQERKAWEIERTALKTRVADLEFKLNKASAGRRRLSNEPNIRSSNSEFHVPLRTETSHFGGGRHHSNTFANVPLEHLKHEHGKPVWQPESPLPATRVFSHDDDVQHLASISEDVTSASLSPQSSHENKPIPIQEIDETLDGITVKSEGVKSSFNRIISPVILASPGRPLSPKQSPQDPPGLRLDVSNLLDPLDAKLKKNAGHTPLAFDGSLSSAHTTGGDPTPREEKPLAPVPTTRPPLRPSERSDSYFSSDDLNATIHEEEEPVEQEPQYSPADDKPLSGPLMLDASGRSAASHVFLDELDQKLEEEVRKSLSNSPERSPARTEQSAKTDEDSMPPLRLKQNTNFGSAYGARVPGICDR